MSSSTSSPQAEYENNGIDLFDYSNVPTTSHQAYRFQNKLVPAISAEQIIIVEEEYDEENIDIKNNYYTDNTQLSDFPRKRGRRSKVRILIRIKKIFFFLG